MVKLVPPALIRALFLSLACSLCAAVQAQQADCAGAVFLSGTDDWEISELPAGPGAQEALSTPCRPGGLPETKPVWLSFQTQAAGLLEFTLTPLQEGDDLDFVLYRVGSSDEACNQKMPVRCMAAGPRVGLRAELSAACLGPTGLRQGSAAESAAAGCTGRPDNFLAPLPTEAGDRFLLLVNNYTSSHGFRLEWGGQLVLAPNWEQSAAFPLRLFPNPAQDRLFLELELPVASRVEVTARDALGRLISTAAYDGAAGGQRLELETSRWAPGMYWVSVVVDGVRVVRLVEKV